MESWEIIDELAFFGSDSWEDSHDETTVVMAISSPEKVPHLSEENLCELEKRVEYLIEKRMTPSSPIRATVNSILNNKPAPLAKSPLRENAESFRRNAQPFPTPPHLSSKFESRMREYMSAHSERSAKFEEAVYRQREEMQEKMAEMMNLLNEYTKAKTPEKVLVRKENDNLVTKFVNSISNVYKDNNKEEKTTINTPTIEEPPKSQPLGSYLKHNINEKTINNWMRNDRRNYSSKKISKEKRKKMNMIRYPEDLCMKGYLREVWL